MPIRFRRQGLVRVAVRLVSHGWDGLLRPLTVSDGECYDKSQVSLALCMVEC